MYGYIYKITNLVNGKIYVGQHKSNIFEPNKYLGSGVALKKAIEKYGINSFSQELVEWCESKQKLNEREMFWINNLNSNCSNIGYNLTLGGDGGDTFSMDSIEGKQRRREKISKSNRNPSKETREKMSKSRKGKFHHSEESKLKMSKARKGRKLTLEWKEKIRASHLGKKGKPLTENQKLHQRLKQSHNHIKCVELDKEFVSYNDAARYFSSIFNVEQTTIRMGISYALKHSGKYKNYTFIKIS